MFLTVYPSETIDVPETPIFTLLRNPYDTVRVTPTGKRRDNPYGNDAILYGKFLIPLRSCDINVVKQPRVSFGSGDKKPTVCDPIAYSAETKEYGVATSNSGFKLLGQEINTYTSTVGHTSAKFINRLIKKLEVHGLNQDYASYIYHTPGMKMDESATKVRRGVSKNLKIYDGNYWFKDGTLLLPAKDLGSVDLTDVGKATHITLRMVDDKRKDEYRLPAISINTVKKFDDEGFAKELLEFFKVPYDVIEEVKYLDNGSIDPRSFVGENYTNHFALAKVKFICVDKEAMKAKYPVINMKGREEDYYSHVNLEDYLSMVIAVGDKIPENEPDFNVIGSRACIRIACNLDLDTRDDNGGVTNAFSRHGSALKETFLCIREFEVLVYTPRDNMEANAIIASTIAKHDLPMPHVSGRDDHGTRVGGVWSTNTCIDVDEDILMDTY